MAEVDNKTEEGNKKESEEGSKAPEHKEEEKTLAGGFKSVEELETGFKDLETKLGTQGDELGQLREFQNQAYPIMDAVYGDEALMKGVRQKVEAKYGVGNSNQAVPQKESETNENGKTTETTEVKPDDRVSEHELFLRQIAINNFKTRYGLDKLPEGEYKPVEDALVKTMERWVQPGTKVPIEKVEPLLEDAWKIVKGDKLVEEKVLETVTRDRVNQQGTVGSMAAGSPESGGVELSEADRKFAEKLKVPLDKVRVYKERYAKGNFDSILED